MRQLFDDPIHSVAEDDLDRVPFAKSLANLIDATPASMSARFAIYGEWGEGKTSVMRLVASELASRSHAIAWFAPWAAASPDDAWHGLLVALDDAASGVDQRLWARAKYRASRVAAGLSRQTADLAELSEYTKPLKIVAAPVEKAGRALLRRGRKIALDDIRRALGKKRITIFVDDLDRVDPQVIPRLLMSFRETFDIPRFTFVLGLSPSLIEDGLTRAGYTGGDSARRFLEKIVDYPFYLPPMSAAGRLKLIGRAERENARAVRSESMQSINSLLPNNPRRLKTFLRHVLSMRDLLSRFADDEIEWMRIYVALLLRLEFPSETYALIEDEAALRDMAGRAFMRIVQEHSGKKPELARPEEAHAPTVGGERFLALCEMLAEGNGVRDARYPLGQILRLPDDPPVMTWLEVGLFADRVSKLSRDEIASQARAQCGFDKGEGGFSTAKARALFSGMVARRDDALSAAIDAKNPTAVRDHMETEALASRVIGVLGAALGWFESGILDENSWRQLYHHCARWSAYVVDPLFSQGRERELALLADITPRLPKEAQLDVVSTLNRPLSREEESSAAFKEMRGKLLAPMVETVVNHLLRVFETPDGIRSYLHQDWTWRGRNFLFEPELPFHSAVSRERLRGVALNPSRSSTVTANFDFYLMILVVGATQGGVNLSPDDTRRLLLDDVFLGIVWTGATSTPLPFRTIGTLLDYRRRLAGIGAKRAVMTIPESWKSYGDAHGSGDLVEELTRTDASNSSLTASDTEG